MSAQCSYGLRRACKYKRKQNLILKRGLASRHSCGVLEVRRIQMIQVVSVCLKSKLT
jgi:hypothetical protein